MERLQGLKNSALEKYQRYQRFLPAGFFIAGFLFDIVTLSRIDDVFSIVQQALYLVVILTILRHRYLEAMNLWTPQSPSVAKIWRWNDEILHFLLGSLLSLYTLFYFVSASLSTSFSFMLFMAALLVLNEVPRFQSQGLQIKFALFALALFSFLSCLVPLALGFVGLIPFILSIALGVGLIASLWNSLKKKYPEHDSRQYILIPSGIVAAVLVVLYIVKALPPIPLSAQYIGIYHEIERSKIERAGQGADLKYVLKYDRPWWKIWENGAQTFLARPGDKIFCFVRIFSPTNFKDEVVYHWLKKTEQGWQSQDRIINQISGGRDEGFRGYAFKSNYDPGDWRVQVETKDGREIGRIAFSVVNETSTDEREFKIDEY